MHKLLFILCCLVGSSVLAISPRTYYVSNAGNNSNNGLTPASSWLTLAQVNATAFNNGDSVLFRRGDLFYGSLTNYVSGITFSSYGTGAKPIVSGFVTIAGWTSLGSNLYEALVPNGLSTVNMVVNANGRIMPMGRYPNAGDANSGYLTYENANNSTPSITDAQLTNTPNWNGVDIVIRKQDYSITRNQVVGHVDSVLTINTPGQFQFRLGDRSKNLSYGYFFENSLATLDQNGEWYYDPATTKLKMYYTSTPPTVQVATIATLLNFPNDSAHRKTNITISNLAFSGSESDLMYISYNSNVLLDSCDFSYAGGSGFEHRNDKYLTVQNCSFSDINMLGMYEVNPGLPGDSAVLVQNNKFNRIGIWPGMLVKNNPNYQEGASHSGISAGCMDLTIRNNQIDSVGYCGIIVGKSRERQIVRQNLVSHYCFLKNDGGGIYNSGIRSDTASTIPLIVDSNIVNSSGNASDGTAIPDDPHAKGIYMDASSNNVQILNNTVYDSYEGIYISQAQRIVIRNNTIYGAGRFLLKTIPVAYSRYSAALNINNTLTPGYQHTSGNTITNNTFFASGPNQPFLYQADRFGELANVGVIDSNRYVNPMGDFPFYVINTSDYSAPARYGFKDWKLATAYDAHSTYLNSVQVPAYSKVIAGSNQSPNSTFTADIGSTTAYSPSTTHTLTWDNTSQLTGTGSAKLVNTATSGTDFTQVLQVIGALVDTNKYVLRFKTRATKVGTFQTYLAQRSGSYNTITSTQFGTVDTAYQQHELFFAGEHSTEATAGVYINFSQSSQTIYIDDIEFYKVSSYTPNVMSDYVLFSANKTTTPNNIGLGSFSYSTLAGNSINTITTVPSYGSILLFKGAAFTPPIYLNPIKLRFAFRRSP